jgi:hypothetical protein
VSVDSFWKRAPRNAVAGSAPKSLSELVPYWFDDRFATERSAGVLVGAEDTGALIGALLRLRATDEAGRAAAEAFARRPDDWDDEWMVGTIPAGAVAEVAEFLARTPFDSLDPHEVTSLAERAAKLGYTRPFAGAWAEQVLTDAREVAALFRAAATAGEPVIVKISA